MEFLVLLEASDSLAGSHQMHVLFQQLGEVLSGIRGLHDNIAIRQAQAEQLHDLVRSDLANLRRDQRELEDKFDCVVCIAQHDIDGLRNSSVENTRSIRMLVTSVDALRRPIVDILSLRSRVAAVLFVAGVLGSSALWLVEPIYHWFVDSKLPH